MPRLFTGIEIPSGIVLALDMLRGGLPGARWIDRENYHITLRFIGDVDDSTAHEAVDVLSRIERAAFDLHLEGLASFGGRKPRAVVASVANEPALMELQAEQERLLRRIGLEPEARKYTPHVTLARVRGGSVNQLIIDSLAAEIARVRADDDFTARAKQLLERDREILDRLAK